MTSIAGALQKYASQEMQNTDRLSSAILGSKNLPMFRTLEEVHKLSAAQMQELYAFNPHSRWHWTYALAEELCLELGARAPFYIPNTPVHAITVTDRRGNITWPFSNAASTQYEDQFNAISIRIRELRELYSVLRQFDHVGMLDAAFYVSAQKMFGVRYVANFHLHTLVWGAERSELDRVQRFVNKRFNSNVKGTPAMSIARSGAALGLNGAEVPRGDFLGWLAYLAKSPINQYQAFRSKENGERQRKRVLQGSNFLRIYELFGDLRLGDLVCSGGRGHALANRARERTFELMSLNA